MHNIINRSPRYHQRVVIAISIRYAMYRVIDTVTMHELDTKVTVGQNFETQQYKIGKSLKQGCCL